MTSAAMTIHGTKRHISRSCVARWSSGQTAAEFAIMALPLLMITFGILMCGMAVYNYNFVCDAARDGVRYAIVHGSDTNPAATATDIKNYVLAEAQGMNKNNLSVSTTWLPNNNPGSVVKVKVTYNFQPLFPMSKTVLPLSSSSQMVISY
jgi:Flp pilus assembly protein TadG